MCVFCFFFISSKSLGLGLLLTEESEQGANETSWEACSFSNISLLGSPHPQTPTVAISPSPILWFSLRIPVCLGFLTSFSFACSFSHSSFSIHLFNLSAFHVPGPTLGGILGGGQGPSLSQETPSSWTLP